MHNELIRAEGGLPPGLSYTVQSLSGREVLDTLFRQKWRILLLWSIVAGATLAYIFLTPNLYETEMTILVKDKRVDAAMPDGAERPDGAATDTQLATEMQLLAGRELFEEVVRKTGLAASQSPADVERAVVRLRKQIRIAPVLKSSVIQVRYSDTDAKRCALVLRTLAERYMDKHLELHSSPGSFEFFSRQAEEYEKKLREAHDRLVAFQARTNIVLLPEQKEMTLRKLLEIEAAYREAKTAKDETDLRISKLRDQLDRTGGRITTQMRRIPNQYSIERLNTLLTELQNKRTELLTKFRADDRMVKQVDQQIADTRKAFERASAGVSSEEATDVNPVRQTMENELARAEVLTVGLDSRIRSLSSQIAGYRGELSKLDGATPDGQQLVDDVKMAEQNYALYSRKREEARISQEMNREKIANVAIVDAPHVPVFPRSKLGSGAPAAALLCFILVVALCFALGHRRNVVHTPWELESSTGLPVLATIPLGNRPLIQSHPAAAAEIIEVEGQVAR